MAAPTLTAAQQAEIAKQAQIEQIGRAFIQHYYGVFDKDRSQLGSLYQPVSLLTFEGAGFRGPEAIVGKFVSLPFKSIAHAIKSVDCAESAAGILVFVTGDLKVEGETNALKFGQLAMSKPVGPGPSDHGAQLRQLSDLTIPSLCVFSMDCQVFLLMPTAPNSQNFYVHNDVFRLNYG